MKAKYIECENQRQELVKHLRVLRQEMMEYEAANPRAIKPGKERGRNHSVLPMPRRPSVCSTYNRLIIAIERIYVAQKDGDRRIDGLIHGLCNDSVATRY